MSRISQKRYKQTRGGQRMQKRQERAERTIVDCRPFVYTHRREDFRVGRESSESSRNDWRARDGRAHGTSTHPAGAARTGASFAWPRRHARSCAAFGGPVNCITAYRGFIESLRSFSPGGHQASGDASPDRFRECLFPRAAPGRSGRLPDGNRRAPGDGPSACSQPEPRVVHLTLTFQFPASSAPADPLPRKRSG